MASRTDPGTRLLALWQRLERLPAGRWVFARLFRRVVPYSGALGARILELEPGHARVALPDRRGVRNHLRSIHAAAQANLAEMATGLALISALPPSARGILVRLSIDYLKKARGLLVAECRCTLPPIEDDLDLRVQGEIRDGEGDLVSRAEATWRVGPKR